MPGSLKSKALHGLFWSFFERAGQQGIQFVISVILARILLPAEFGLVAMSMIFMAIAQVFVDGGFGQALIQKKNTTHADECSIFYFNILLSVVSAALLCLAAPWIARFYSEPLLTPMTRVLSLNLVINAFGLVQTTLLTKNVNFKAQFKVSVIASALSGAIGIAMAYSGYGVWSLVVQSLSSNLLRTVLLWIFHGWRPGIVFSAKSLGTMFGFGSKLLVSNVLESIFSNLYIIVIGKVFTATDLGFYSRAQRLQQLPSRNISSTMERVTFPIFSSLQADSARLKRGMRKAITMLVMINFPVMVGLAAASRPLVFVLLTEKWLPCVPYLQLLCAVGVLYPLHVVNLNVLNAQGRSDLYLFLQILRKILQVAAIVLTYRWGITAMIYGQIATSFLCYYLNAYYTAKLLDYPAGEQIRDLAPYLALSCVTGASIYALSFVPFPTQLALLATQVVVGASMYCMLCRLLKLPPFMEALELLKPRLLALRRARNC